MPRANIVGIEVTAYEITEGVPVPVPSEVVVTFEPESCVIRS
jgi:hypothetical protein